MMHSLSGIFAASVTPLRPDYSPDIEALPDLLNFLVSRGCHGVLLLGTTGEGPSFSISERLEIIKSGLRFRETHPACKILAGTGTPSISETIHLTRSAFEAGVDGVVVLPPYYYRKAGDAGLFKWFKTLIQNAVPADGFLLGYHFPNVAGIGFSIDLLARLKESFPFQFAGIKDSSHDPDFSKALGDHFGDEMVVLTGTDSYLQLAMRNHAVGCITAPANLISPDLRRIWDGFLVGQEISEIQAKVTELRRIMEKNPPFPPLLKSLLSRQHGFPYWPVRPPLEDTPVEIVDSVLFELAHA